MAAFQNGAGALLAVLPPGQLVFKKAVDKGRLQLFQTLFAAQLPAALGLPLGPGIAGIDIRVQVTLFARLAVLMHPCQPLQLAAQQVDLFEIAASFTFFVDQSAQPHLQCALDPVHGLSLVPCICRFPLMHRGARHVNVLGNMRYPPAHPVQGAGLAALVLNRGGQSVQMGDSNGIGRPRQKRGIGHSRQFGQTFAPTHLRESVIGSPTRQNVC